MCAVNGETEQADKDIRMGFHIETAGQRGNARARASE